MMFVCLSVCLCVCLCVCLSVCLCVTLRSQMIGSIGTLETVFGVFALVYMRKSCKSVHLFQDRTDLLHHRRCICNHLDDSKSLHYFLCSNMFAEHTKGPSGHLALRVFSSFLIEESTHCRGSICYFPGMLIFMST